MKKLLVLGLGLWMASTTGMAFAQAATGGTTMGQPGTHTPKANRRMRRQKNRIKQGVKSGQLTKDETATLKDDHKALRQEIKDAKSDGTVTKDERKQIQKDENAESKKIYDLKHNDTTKSNQ